MMRFLRRLRRLGRWAYSLLARRARELPHLRYAYLALVPISLPPLAWGYYPPVTRGWESSLDYLAPWLIFSATLVLLIIRGDRPRRKNVRRPLGPKFLWSGIATSEFGLVVLALYPLVSGAGEWLSQIAPQAALIVGFVAIATFLYALAVVLPLVFLFTARVIAPVKIRRWRLGRRASPGNVYAVLPLGVAGLALIFFFLESPSSIIGLAIVLVVCAFAFLFRHEPWRRTTPLPPAMLPHIGFLYGSAVLGVVGLDTVLGLQFEARWGLTPDPHRYIIVLIAILGPAATLIYWGAAKLRVPLVVPQSKVAGAALSIYPNPATYVDGGGYAAHLENLIRTSDGGVIGVTGLRGAGKSALLGYVLSRFERQHGVLWMTAPVSHERGMAFLMSVCRALCTKALRDAEPILYGRTTERGRAFAEFLRRASVLIIVVLSLGALAGVGWLGLGRGTLNLGQAGGPVAWLNSPPLPFPDRVYVYGSPEPVQTLPYYEGDLAYATVVNAERDVVRDLLKRATTVLDAERDVGEGITAVSNHGGVLLLPVPSGVGFDLVPFEGGDSSAILQDPNPWLLDPERADAEAEDLLERLRVSFVCSSFEQLLCPHSNAFPYYDLLSRISGDSTSVEIFGLRPGFSDSALFANYVLGALPDRSREGGGALVDYFSGLETIRGYESLQPQLRAHTASLRNLLDLESEGARPTEVASILLIKAFFQAPEKMFFDRARLRRLVEILEPYLATLDGETVKPAGIRRTLEAGIEPAAGGRAFAMLPGLAPMEWVALGMLFLIALVMFLGERLWRLGNFLVRGILNFHLLTLVRDSEEFIQYLNYSEGREASAGLSLRGLSVGGKTVLTARTLTLQGLTDRYLDYVRNVRRYYNGKLIVAIDELDKVVDPAQVRDILLEIKGALFEKGCFYLVSISQDAARAFRGRLTEGRDIFESSFDDVLSIAQMDTASAALMIEKRLGESRESPRLSDESVLLLTVFGSGIPREIVRNLRSVTLDAEPRELIPPQQVALRLFQAAVQQWIDHLPEIELSGDAAVQLRTGALDVLGSLEGQAEREVWPDVIRTRLEECLKLLDPGNARLAAAGDQPPRLREVQHCLRLMIMDALLEKFWRDDPGWETKVDAALECLRVLPDQPALAEVMLDEMRASGENEPLAEQTWRHPKNRSRRAGGKRTEKAPAGQAKDKPTGNGEAAKAKQVVAVDSEPALEPRQLVKA